MKKLLKNKVVFYSLLSIILLLIILLIVIYFKRFNNNNSNTLNNSNYPNESIVDENKDEEKDMFLILDIYAKFMIKIHHNTVDGIYSLDNKIDVTSFENLKGQSTLDAFLLLIQYMFENNYVQSGDSVYLEAYHLDETLQNDYSILYSSLENLFLQYNLVLNKETMPLEEKEKIENAIANDETIQEQINNNDTPQKDTEVKENDNSLPEDKNEQSQEPKIEANTNTDNNTSNNSSSNEPSINNEPLNTYDIDSKDNKMLLSASQIKQYNAKIASKTSALYNLGITYYSKEKIMEYVNSYSLPLDTKYNDGIAVTNNEKNQILENRNLDNIKAINAQKGIVVKRSNLKSFPTDIHFYSNKNERNFDDLQETELLVNVPVLILHESKDGKWFFVISKTYYGWVKKENIAYATDDDYNYFINTNSFAVITKASLNVNGVNLDMSVTLPYQKEVSGSYKLVLPYKGADGMVMKQEITIAKENASIGYLPFTKENLFKQAFEYKETPYRWGGMDYGVDCSSFVGNVFRTFGFVFPRNTSDQNKSVGEVVSLTGLPYSEKLNKIANSFPSLLYMPGHVVMYLGVKNNKYYIINATANRRLLKVTEEVLDSSNYLASINKLVLIR